MHRPDDKELDSKEQAEEEVRAIVRDYKPRLNLQEWHIEIEGAEKDLPDPDEDGECLMDCNADPVYLQAKIRIFPAFGKRKRRTRERAVVHELCHLVTQEARDLANRARLGKMVTVTETTAVFERMTQRIANIATAKS
jgi:hypothetical protein